MKKNIKKDKPKIYVDLLTTINMFSYFSCEMILPEDVDDFFEEYGKEYENSDEFFETLDPILEQSHRVMYLTGTLVDTEFIDFINTWEQISIEDKKKHIKKDYIDLLIPVTVHYGGDEHFTTLYVVDLFKIKTKRRKKTEIELQSELDDALKIENYELAVKIREKIKKIKKYFIFVV
jgi:hypothetical protein